MNEVDLKKSSRSDLLTQLASRETDPRFYAAMTVLPNPDKVLRKLGMSGEVFDAVISDAHVIGDLRSVRAGLLRYEYRVVPGGKSAQDLRAFALCEQIIKQRNIGGMRIPDINWNMATSVFRGMSVHEAVLRREGNYLVPDALIDTPNRRFVWSTDNTLRLLTRHQPWRGEALGPNKWLVTRHMPSYDNPYGVALFSSCFWPYTFKHSGYRYFVKFCERYGIPKAIGEYPPGTTKADQDALVDALAQMIEDAVAAIPQGGGVKLLETSTTGELVHERLINLCNREMSKALTSQTLAMEIQGDGSRAAAETHRDREEGVNDSDRTIVEDTWNQLFIWITRLNFKDAIPPRFEFYEESQARKDWADVFDVARDFLDIPTDFAHDRLQIPLPEKGQDVLPRKTDAAAPGAQFSGSQAAMDFAAGYPALDALDTALASLDGGTIQEDAQALLTPFFKRLEALGPDEVLTDLAALYPDLDTTALEDRASRIIFVAMLWGRLNGDDDA